MSNRVRNSMVTNVSNVIEECWKESKEFSWEQSKKELLPSERNEKEGVILPFPS